VIVNAGKPSQAKPSRELVERRKPLKQNSPFSDVKFAESLQGFCKQKQMLFCANIESQNGKAES